MNGDLAEDSFRRWCTLCNMAATKAVPDRMGWDYFVEMDAQVDPSNPLDRQPSLFKFLAQVKSSNTTKKSVRVKLSAIKRLVDTDLPAFIIFVAIDSSSDIIESRLLHIGEKQIEDILTATRRAEAGGRTDLNNIKISLSLAQAEIIDLNSKLIPDHILRISRDQNYISWKRNFRSSCGYGLNSIKAHIVFGQEVDNEKIIDFMIGAIPSLRVERMEIRKSRFGIVVDKDVDHIEGATITLGDNEGQDGIIIASSRMAGARASLGVKICVPAMANMDHRRVKIRIHNDHIEMICDFETGNCTFKFYIYPHNIYYIDNIIDAIRFREMLMQPDCTVEIEAEDKRLMISKALTFDGKHSHSSTALKFAELLVSAARRSGYRKALETSLSELEQAIDENKSSFVTLTRAGIEFTFDLEESAPPSFPDLGIVFQPVAIDFKGLIYSAVVKAEADIKLSDDRHHATFVCAEPAIVEELLTEKDRFDIAALNQRIEHFGKQTRSDSKCVVTTVLQETED